MAALCYSNQEEEEEKRILQKIFLEYTLPLPWQSHVIERDVLLSI